MADKRNGSTDKLIETSLGLTLAPSSDLQPIAYDDNVWDVVEATSDLGTLLGSGGQYDQHVINETLAKYSGGGAIMGSLSQCVCLYNGSTATVNGEVVELNNGGVTTTSYTITIPERIHKCGKIPFAVCYQDDCIVDFNVSKNNNGDTTIGWNGLATVDAQHPLLIKLVGNEDSEQGDEPVSYITDKWIEEHGYVTEEYLEEHGYVTESGANQYVFLCKNYARALSTTITAAKHGCGMYPVVTCYRDNKIVVTSVSRNMSGDITVGWENVADVTPSTPMYISIVGMSVAVDVEPESEPSPEPDPVDPITPTKYTATFHLAQGMNDIVYNLDDGDTIPDPDMTNVTRPGYAFVSWTNDIANTIIHANVEDFAVWTEEPEPEPEVTKYIASFYSDGSLYQEDEYEEGESVIMPVDPEKSGYRFVGWYCMETPNHAVPSVMPAYDLMINADFEEDYVPEPEDELCPECGQPMWDGECTNTSCPNSPYYIDPNFEEPIEEEPFD